MVLLATDADEVCLDRARSGRFAASSVKDVPADMQAKYFHRQKGGRQMLVRQDRLPPIRWQPGDLLDGPPGAEAFHLILLRNSLLTYYRGPALKTALTRILARLLPGGLLAVGAHEQLPPLPFSLFKEKTCPWVYRLDR